MAPEAIVLRNANPTYEDGLEYARFVDMASEGGYRYALGRRFPDIVAMAFTAPAHDMSYEYTVFAEANGRTVGMASGYTAGQHKNSSDAPLKKAPGSRRMRALRLSMLQVFYRILAEHDERDFYLHFLAVDAAFRGQGIGSLLIEFMEKRARASGSSRFTLDVAARNLRAAKLYARHGLTAEVVEQRSRWRSLFVHRLAKDL